MFDTAVTLQSGLRVFQERLASAVIDFVPRGPVLVITFEPALAPGDPYRDDRDGWGMAALLGAGYSVMAVKSRSDNWYRGADLLTFLKSEELGEFLRRFDTRLFYGASMGAYAALAFSAIAPGSLVLAYAPQTTLNPALVAWDSRFAHRQGGDWTGDFGDARDSTASAQRVYVVFDPMEREDVAHVRRLSGDNIERLRLPFGGHACANLLARHHLLIPVVQHALRRDTGFFPKLARVRRADGGYLANMARRLRNPKARRRLLLEAWRLDPANAFAAQAAMAQAAAEKRHDDVVTAFEPFRTHSWITRKPVQAMFLMAIRAHLATGAVEEARRLCFTLSRSPVIAPINVPNEIADGLTQCLVELGESEWAASWRDHPATPPSGPSDLSGASIAPSYSTVPWPFSWQADDLDLWLAAKAFLLMPADEAAYTVLSERLRRSGRHNDLAEAGDLRLN